ncbi:MAG: hypothetical protein WC497_03025 [Patescibacteria group bacterium]
MDHKEAAAVLISMLKKQTLSTEEKEAVETAVGVLGWTYLSKNKVKKLKNKRKSIEL